MSFIDTIAKVPYLKEFQRSADSEAHLFIQLRENVGNLGTLLDIQLSNTPGGYLGRERERERSVSMTAVRFHSLRAPAK